MSKKKKKKKSRSNYYYCEHPVVSDKDLKYMLSGVDKTIDKSYNSLLDEIRRYQLDIKLSDVEAEKKQRKQLKKELGVIPYYCRKEQNSGQEAQDHR